MTISEKYLLLWQAVNAAMKTNLELAELYATEADRLATDDNTSIDSVSVRGRATGLLYANNNIIKELNERGLMNLD
jgi:hypothetical protein